MFSYLHNLTMTQTCWCKSGKIYKARLHKRVLIQIGV